MTHDPATDLDVLDLDVRQVSALNRRTAVWLAGLLMLVAVATVWLGVFLVRVEAQEAERQRNADADWLDQTLRFHFRRLEKDLEGLAVQTLREPGRPAELTRAGQLWRGAGVIVQHGWVAVEPLGSLATWPPALRAALAQHERPEDAGALTVMLDTGRGLQRAAYAGPMAATDAPAVSLLWLAVPVFEQGRYLGSYVAAIDVERALEQAVPAWFLQDHALHSAPATTALDDTVSPLRYTVPVNLPGAQWTLDVRVLATQVALAPRVFFAVALLFLLGMAVALVLLARDVVRRRQAETRLQHQVALRTAMERAITLGLRAWGLDGRLLYANQAFARLVGWSVPELLAQGVRPLYWPADAGVEWHTVQRCAEQTPDRQLGLEQRLLHCDGHMLDVLLHAAPLVQADGRVIGWMGSVLDLTERKRVEQLAARQQEKLEASARLVAVGEVASTLAHELNQPLGALSGFATGLLNRLRGGRIGLDEIAPVVERMERLADKAGRVIQRVNAFARRQEMSRQPLELRGFLRRVVAQVPVGQDVRVEFEGPADDLTVPADALLLEHALHNLVLNATEWAPLGEQRPALVRVSLSGGPEQVTITVEDSGPGVPESEQSRIFEAFASQKPGGMGMGLSICRSIVEAHHGRIEVGRSATLGGAQFTVWLPLNP